MDVLQRERVEVNALLSTLTEIELTTRIGKGQLYSAVVKKMISFQGCVVI